MSQSGGSRHVINQVAATVLDLWEKKAEWLESELRLVKAAKNDRLDIGLWTVSEEYSIEFYFLHR